MIICSAERDSCLKIFTIEHMTKSTTIQKKIFTEIAQSTDLHKLNLTIRTKNVFCAQGGLTIEKIVGLSDYKIKIMRNAGEGTFKEMIRALLRLSLAPHWLKFATAGFKYPEVKRLNEDQETVLELEGWCCITSGYKPKEYWMLEEVIADLERGGISYRLYRARDGIRIFRQGGIVLEDSAED